MAAPAALTQEAMLTTVAWYHLFADHNRWHVATTMTEIGITLLLGKWLSVEEKQSLHPALET